jgi:hypothetical protein
MTHLSRKLIFASMSAALALSAGCQSLGGAMAVEPTSGLQQTSDAGGLLVLVGLAFCVTVPLDLMILWATPDDPFPITRALFHACN